MYNIDYLSMLMAYVSIAVASSVMAIGTLYLPSYDILVVKASANPEINKKIKNFLNWKYMGIIIFALMVFIVFPIILPALFFEKSRDKFITNFVKGVLSS